MVGHTTGEHSAAIASRVLDVETDERLLRVLTGHEQRPTPAATSSDDIPRAVLLAIGADGASASSSRRRPAASSSWRWTTARTRPSSSASRGRASGLAPRRPRGHGLRGAALRPRGAHAVVRAVRRGSPRRFERSVVAARGRRCGPARPPRLPDRGARRSASCSSSTGRARSSSADHREALREGARVFVEAGPRGNMTALHRGHPARPANCAVASDVRRRSGVTQLNHLAGLLAVHAVDVDLGYLFAERHANEVDLRGGGAQPHANRRSEIRLATAWPMLRLSPDAVERLRPAASRLRGSDAQPLGDGNAAPPQMVSAPQAAPAAARAAPLPPSSKRRPCCRRATITRPPR